MLLVFCMFIYPSDLSCCARLARLPSEIAVRNCEAAVSWSKSSQNEIWHRTCCLLSMERHMNTEPWCGAGLPGTRLYFRDWDVCVLMSLLWCIYLNCDYLSRLERSDNSLCVEIVSFFWRLMLLQYIGHAGSVSTTDWDQHLFGNVFTFYWHNLLL